MSTVGRGEGGLALGAIASAACAAWIARLGFDRLALAAFGAGTAEQLAILGAGAAGLGALLAAAAAGREDRNALHAGHLAALACAALAVGGIELTAATHVGQRPGATALGLEGVPLIHRLGVWTLPAVGFGALGAALAFSLARAARRIPAALAAALLGSAAGVVAGAAALRAGGPRTPLVAAAVAALASVLWIAAARRSLRAANPGAMFLPAWQGASIPPSVTAGPSQDAAERDPRAGGVLAPGRVVSLPGLSLPAMFLAGMVAMVAGDIGAPYLKPQVDRPGLPDRVVWSAWSELSLLEIERPVAGVRWARLDAVRQAPIHDAPPPTVRPEELAFFLASGAGEEGGAAAVLDAGGGALVRSALRAGFSRVDAFSLSPQLPRALASGAAGPAAAEFLGEPRVFLHAGDGRTELARAVGTYRAVVVARHGEPERQIAQRPARDALALATSTLFSTRAIATYFAALAPGGVLLLHHPSAGDALVRAAFAALSSQLDAPPDPHVFACGDRDGTSVLVSRQPLDDSRIGALRRQCRRARAEPRFASGGPEISPPSGLDPPTDDRPFFTERLGPLAALRRYVPPPAAGEPRALGRGLCGAAVALALGALLGAVTVRLREGRGVGGALAAYAASALAGAGAALLAPGALRLAGLSLSHPSRVVVVALPIGLVAAAGGALVGMAEPRGRRLAAAGALALLGGGLAAGALFRGAGIWPALAPAALATLALAAAASGALFGLLFVRSAGAAREDRGVSGEAPPGPPGPAQPEAGAGEGRLAPLLAGGAGLGAALGSQLAVPLAAHVGFSSSALAGGLALAFAAALGALVASRQAPVAAP